MTPYYQDDLVTIYLGDCREWMPEADVIVTDPPYGIGWNTDAARTRHGPGYPPIFGDDESFDPSRLLALGVPTVLFGGNHYADRLPPSSSWIVWDKRPSGYTNDQSDCELVWTNLGGPARVIRKAWSGGGTLARENGSSGRGRSIHPTQKPVDVMRDIILRTTGTILDPFMGSGSTLVAAKSLNRRSIGIEIDERYCETAANRCRQEVLGMAL